MKNSRKAWVVFRRFLFIMFVIYLINYFSVSSGYYESQVNKKVTLTEEKIKEFEEDVKNEEYVDIKDYVSEPYVDTSSVAGNVGYKFSETVNDFVTNKAISVFKFIGKLFS